MATSSVNKEDVYTDPKLLRHAIRQKQFNKPTSGQCPGYLQAKWVKILINIYLLFYT